MTGNHHSRIWRLLGRAGVGLLASALVVLIALFSFPISARATTQADASASPRSFAEDFYRWYVHLAQGDTSRPWEAAIRLREAQFGPELARLLKEDAIAQSHCREIVGIDFDPILNTQDPAQRYELGRLAQKNHRYLIDVYAVLDGVKNQRPDVTAVFVSKGGHYAFVNFLYPEGHDLLNALTSPRPVCSVPRAAKDR